MTPETVDTARWLLIFGAYIFTAAVVKWLLGRLDRTVDRIVEKVEKLQARVDNHYAHRFTEVEDRVKALEDAARER